MDNQKNKDYKHDYSTVAIPNDLNQKDYDTRQRRAEIYERIRDKGFGGLDTYRNLAEEYGVKSPNSIKQDIEDIRKYMLEEDFNREKFRTKISDNLMWAAKKAREENDYSEASKIAKRINKYMQSIGVEEEEPDKVEVERSVSDNLRKAFKKHHEEDEE